MEAISVSAGAAQATADSVDNKALVGRFLQLTVQHARTVAQLPISKKAPATTNPFETKEALWGLDTKALLIATTPGGLDD